MRIRTVPLWVVCLMISACGEDAAIGSGTEGSDAPASGSDAGASEAQCDAKELSCEEFGTERPGRLSEHSAVYDPDQNEMVVFGGTPTIPMECSFGGRTEYKSETWIYSDGCKRWLKVAADGPQASGRHMAAWAQGDMWVLGGRFRAADVAAGEYTVFSELHRFDVAERSWSTASAKGSPPSARMNAALVYDPSREKLWLFGGNTSTNGGGYLPQNDLYSLDLDELSWTQHAVPTSPSRRLFHSMAYDSVRDRLVMFGGTDENAFMGDATYSDELLALNLEDLSWARLKAGPNPPPGRFWSSIVYDSKEDSYVLFGGHDDTTLGNRNDTWRYDPSKGRWKQVGPEDTLQSEQRGFCDFPPDFAKIEKRVPERRNAHSFVWSESCGHGLLFGGKTDCGSADDVWRFSGNAWQKRVAATEGEACHRWRDDPTRCNDVCF